MNSAKHILFLVPGFPKDENDFNCIPPLQEFLLKFKSAYPSARISVIAFQYPYRSKEYFWNGIKIFPLNGKNYVIKKPVVWFNGYRKSLNIHKTNPVDVIHSLWLGECAMIGDMLSKKFNCTHVCTLMGQDVISKNKYLRLSKIEEIRIIALSQNQSDQFLKLSNRKVDDIIHWGIDDQNFEYVERDIDLLAVGSLIPIKNYSLFIKLITELSNNKPDLKCKLVGTGPEFSKLSALANNNGISENIEFTGLLNRTEIFKLMQRSKIFVHPSKFEGFGFVFAEALVSGMNIISFNVGCAQQHPKWFIVKDEVEFTKIAASLLSSDLKFHPTNIFPLLETVTKYVSLYGID